MVRNDFDARDLAAYFLGVSSAFLLEQALFTGLAAPVAVRREAI